jgi:hypothetical protein
MARHTPAALIRIAAAGALLAIALLLAVPGASFYYESSGGATCTRCHEMNSPYDTWHLSSHRGVKCEQCHGGAMTLDASFHWNNVNRLYQHLKGNLPEEARLRNVDVQNMTERCAGCHRQEFAQWQSGPHSSTYARIFLDRKHNSGTQLMDDCLRCHGMHFEGGIGDLVTPINRMGPWQMLPAELAVRPVMPCLTCHQMHRLGAPLTKTDLQARVAGPTQEINRPSLALFDRRTQQYVPVERLPVPAMLDGERPLKMSPDQRQALCYQCHAPDASMRAGTGDDRTAMGVHEGIGCLACHMKHGQKTRASCADCHPKMSNCGLDVEKMDTTFRVLTSKHNIHWVKCLDCHPNGAPRKRDHAETISSSR